MTKNVHYFGAHISSPDNMLEGAKLVKKHGGNLVQVFLTRPGQQSIATKNEEEIDNFKKYIKENEMKVVVHSSYIHNFCKNWDSYSWWIVNFENEIELSSKLGAFGIVLHFGSQLNLSIEEAYNNMFSSLIYIHNKTDKFKNVKIFLETPAGQGTQICWKIEDLSYFYKKFKRSTNKELKDRIKLCIDSCHIFSAGHDIRNETLIKLYLESFEELIGLSNVGLIHLNDSKIDLGGRVDRHENIGQGFIGQEPLKIFFNYYL